MAGKVEVQLFHTGASKFDCIVNFADPCSLNFRPSSALNFETAVCRSNGGCNGSRWTNPSDSVGLSVSDFIAEV